jgi:hypothetical protein
LRNQSIISQFITIALLLLAQILLFGHINLFQYAFCFVYITFILSAPVTNGPVVNMLIACAMGAIVDAFNYTMGINAFCALSLAFFRFNIFGLVLRQSKDEQEQTSYTLKGVGNLNFTFYVFLSCLLYTSLYYFLMSFGWAYFWKNILRILSSTILSTLLILGLNLLFFRKEQQL